MNYTSVEQSRKLLELGLKPDSADMVYIEYASSDNLTRRFEDAEPMVLMGVPISEMTVNVLPCWSVGALLDVMPNGIQKYDDRDRSYKTYHPNLYQAYYHCCGYTFGPSLKQENHDTICTFGEDSWIDVLYKQVCWLLENNYIEK